MIVCYLLCKEQVPLILLPLPPLSDLEPQSHPNYNTTQAHSKLHHVLSMVLIALNAESELRHHNIMYDMKNGYSF